MTRYEVFDMKARKVFGSYATIQEAAEALEHHLQSTNGPRHHAIYPVAVPEQEETDHAKDPVEKTSK